MILTHPDGNCSIEPLSGTLKQVSVHPSNSSLFVSRRSIVTSYPADLIGNILAIKGPGYVCDEIARDEDPNYVRFALETDLSAYFNAHQFRGKRILDFGCGSGASTMVLSRLYPDAEILGIELDPKLLSIAKARARHYGFPEERLLLSPAGSEVPAGIGCFDCVLMSAVFEHLLPAERGIILPKLWSLVNPGGFLFLNQTPHRFTPVETHTTGLPLINYLPDRLTHWAACRLSPRLGRNETWATLLRKGIRGGTEYEVQSLLRKASTAYEPVLLEPGGKGLRDRIDLWAVASMNSRLPALKKMLKLTYKTIKFATGLTLVPSLSLAIQKRAIAAA